MQRTALSIFSLLLLSFAAQAQTPQAFKYQAVVRNAAGQVLTNQNVGLHIRLSPADTAMTLYAETHSAPTNAFGLVNLEVGRGTVVSGQFAMIDWAQQPIFIKVSLDATGGSNYAEMGTSELLSVPYALYAANAAGGSGLPTDAEKGDLLYHDGTTWQRLPAGAAGTVLTMGADGLPAWKALPSPLDSLLEVTMTNGEVIYASPVDNGPQFVKWGGYGINITALPDITSVAAVNMDFNGETNTTAIVTQLGANNGTPYAAKVCADLVAYGFDDWYLPAAGELNEMYLKLGPNGSAQITTGYYWSSSEFLDTSAWFQYFDDGNQSIFDKNVLNQCRCVRR